jgi:hypothetical protein
VLREVSFFCFVFGGRARFDKDVARFFFTPPLRTTATTAKPGRARRQGNMCVHIAHSYLRALTLFFVSSFSRRSWCWVEDATCHDAVASVESPGLFYAYFGPCGVDIEQVNVTNCPLHHSWDGMSSRASVFLKHVLTYATGDVQECGEEEEEDTTELKSLSYILGIAIVGSGLGVLIFVWIIRCDPAETCGWLSCAKKSTAVKPSDGAAGEPPDTKANLATVAD